MLLVAGGERDPNLAPLVEAGRRLSDDVVDLRVGPGRHPRLSWDLDRDALTLDGRALRPTAVFARYDVFGPMADPRPEVAARAAAWHTAVTGWARARPEVRLPNRRHRGMSKLEALALARRAGLDVPATVLSNDAEALRALPNGWVVKPVDGGEHCRPLSSVLAEAPVRDGATAWPALAQERLEGPEVRVFVVGERLLPFSVTSDHLDYRTDPDVAVAPLEGLPRGLADGLLEVAAGLGLDWAAADLKTRPGTRELCFLEMNASPMFAAFDAACGGRLCAALAEWLLTPR